MIDSSTEITTKETRILIVDDLPDNCLLLQTALEIEGYVVELAYNGRTALESIAFHPPSLILLDVMMPGIDGIEVTRRLRQNPALPYIPIILVTGYKKPTPTDGFEAGADGFIRKPIDFDDLLHQIRTILQPKDLIEPQK